MEISVENASSTLNNAYLEALKDKSIDCKFSEFIDLILDNTHLTYKYILFTAILSKATDATVNPLALQKKSKLPGAYDARTICHKVIVPFEMETLGKALGGSNEPFLNKPARNKELSTSNPVRNGKDALLLEKLCDTLPQISSKEAFVSLIYIIKKLLIIKEEKLKLRQIEIKTVDDSIVNFLVFCNKVLDKNIEGESLTLLIAGIYKELYKNSSDIIVEVHPVNQSGASSKEVSDLDIYHNDKLIISNELKDKVYSESDVRHAMDKVIESGGNKMFFIEGPRATYKSDKPINSLIIEYAQKGAHLTVISSTNFINVIINLIINFDFQNFIRYCITTAQETKFKEETITHLLDCSK